MPNAAGAPVPSPTTPVTYYVPGKVMLAGEYAVLFGGQALTVTLACGVLVTCTRQHQIAEWPAAEPPASSSSSSSFSPRRPFITVTSSLWQCPRHLHFHELTEADHQELITHTLSQFITHARAHHPTLWSYIKATSRREERPSLSSASAAASFHLDINSELPPAAGIGSSSAISLGVLLTFNHATGRHLDGPELLQLACRSQQLYQRGYGSGYDVISQYYGGIVLTQAPSSQGGTATMVRHHHECTLIKRASGLLGIFAQPQLTASTSSLLTSMLTPAGQDGGDLPHEPHHPTLPLQPPPEFAAICTWQNRLIAQLLLFQLSAELIATAATAQHQLCQHPRFAYPQELFAQLSTLAGFNHHYAVKTTGAGGSDALLSIGPLPAEAKTILSSYGYAPLATSFSARGAHRQ